MEKTIYKISEIGEVVGGGTPSTTNEEFWGGDIPWISPKDLTGYSFMYISHGGNFLTSKGLKSGTRLLPKGTVLFTSRAPIGYVAIASNPICTNQGFKSIVCNEELITPQFLYYYIKANLNYIKLFGTGATFPEISGAAMKKIKIAIPSLPVQQKIASILSTYDTLIENNTKRIRLLEQMAENLYKEWFVRFRFPGHENVEMENGLPKGWKHLNLFDVANITYGYAFKSNKFCEDANLNPVVRIRDIQDNHTNTFTDETCDNKYLIKKNAILVGMDGIFHMCLWNGERAYLNQRVVMLNSKVDNACNYYIHLAIKPQVKYWEQVIAGTTVAHLGDKHLRRIKVIMPDNAILTKANRIIEGVMNEINSLQHQNTLLIQQRDLLLPRLMSGKLEVTL